MMKLFFSIIILFCLLLASCLPSLSFKISNCTDEAIEVWYQICDDLIYPGYDEKTTVHTILEKEGNLRISISNSLFFNRGVEKEDYYKTETFLSLFNDITIKYLESDVLLNKDDLTQYKIKYEKIKPSAHIFYLLVGII